jgi:hypothetical protein
MKQIALILILLVLFSCKSTSSDGDRYPCPVYDEDLQNIVGITETDENGNILETIDTDDWHYYSEKYDMVFPSKPVEISFFEISLLENEIILHWITQSESNNLEWNVYRALSDNIQLAEQINPVPIDGAGTISEPTEYFFTDETGYEFGETYYYWLESIDFSNTSHYSEARQFTIPTEIFFTVGPAYPNPCIDEVTIPYSLAQDSKVTIIIIDEDGKLITTLVNTTKSKGEYEIAWIPENIEAGIYRCIYHVSQTYHWHGDILVQ